MTEHLVSPPTIGPCNWCGIVHRTSGDCSAPRVGQVLAGKYRIVRLIGEGAVAAVYEAHHIEVGRRFAVKFLRPGLLVDHEDVLRRFRREAQAEGLLECENVAGAIDFGYTEQGVAYLVLEHLVGEDLSRLLTREGTLTVARAAGILIQACVGLGAAHAAGIVHRDVKPANLFLCKHSDGSDLVKVLDFGIAKLKWGSDTSPSWTIAGWTMGTPCYMPPEQARGDCRIDHRADIYALGVILFEVLSGARPHPGARYHDVLCHLLTEPPIPIESLRPNLPPGIVAIVRRALASDPNDRYPSTDEMAADLAPFGEGGAARSLAQSMARTAPAIALVPTPERSTLPLITTTDLAAPTRRPIPIYRPAGRMPERWRLLLTVIAAGLVCAAMTWVVHRSLDSRSLDSRSLDSLARSNPSADAERLPPVASRLPPLIVPFDIDSSSQIKAGHRASSARLQRPREERSDK